ncbi:MAG: 23S rRNA (guanosine(2251)-2'-O)-methyltransferase RlmB [Bifidobacteriaceae bacterium]|jgi:23S rRNA (guanosine2251-2'-O)-methyltransferase|nr:23S rRNA (guanosine(2251)-2'-O)-methyltransferase RlmB [Bifidobacteriaceae bacterium]
MPGNSKRKGAVRKPGSKQGPKIGSGGKGRKALAGRGPIPKAVDRPYHPAAKRKAAAERREKARPRAAKKTTGSSAEYVVGRNAVVEALRAHVPAERLEFAAGLETDDRLAEAAKLAARANLPLVQATKAELDRYAGSSAHQGIALRVRPYSYLEWPDLLDRAAESGQPPLIVALDQVTDPHNLGAALRSAAAFGAHGLIIPARRSAQMGATAWKVSAGAAAHLPVAQVPNLTRALEAMKQQGVFVVGLDGDAAVDAAACDLLQGPVAVVVGSEGKGLSRLTREVCDLTVAIPIADKVESLNASVAVGIVLYEAAKARQEGPS